MQTAGVDTSTPTSSERFASAVERLADFLAGSRAASLVTILLVGLACFLPGFVSLPPIEGDEPAYAVAAREMVASADYASVRLQTEDAELAPRGLYWIGALTVALAGGDPPIWVYRIPSLIGAVAAALLTWWTMIAFGRPRAALLAGLLVCGAGVLCLQARLAGPDTILVAALMLSAGSLARVWLRGENDLAAGLFWTGLAIAILVKGIVAPAVLVTAVLILALERGDAEWLKGLRPAVGIPWLLLLLSPWLIAIVLTFLQGADDGPSAEFLARIGVPFALDAPPGTYALLIPLLAGPAVTYLFLAFRWMVEDLRNPFVLFSLAIGAPLWLAAELVTAKMPQNILPAIPAIAMVAAAAVDLGTARITGKISWFYSLGPLVWPPTIAIAIPLAFYFLEGTFPWPAFAALVVAAVLGPITWNWLHAGRMVASAMMSMATVIFIYFGIFGGILPAFTSLRLAERVAATPVPCAAPEYAVAGHAEESMVFALGRGTRLVDAWAAADFLNSAGCRVAAVDRSQIGSFRQRADDLGLPVLDIAQIAGFNPRKMRFVELHLFLVEGAS
jgi:4-amino-4-deoxy-L-arabinose transferase-like glycosyltransferase